MGDKRANLSILMDQFANLGYIHVHTWNDGYGNSSHYSFERPSTRSTDEYAPFCPSNLSLILRKGVIEDILSGNLSGDGSYLLGVVLEQHLYPVYKRIKDEHFEAVDQSEMSTHIFNDLLTAELRKNPRLKDVSTEKLAYLAENWRPKENLKVSECETASWRLWTYKPAWDDVGYTFRTVAVAGHGVLLKPEDSTARDRFYWPKRF